MASRISREVRIDEASLYAQSWIDEDSEQNKTHQRMKILIFVCYFRVLFYLIALFCLPTRDQPDARLTFLTCDEGESSVWLVPGRQAKQGNQIK